MSRKFIVREAKRVVASRWPEVHPAKACFYLSMAVIEAAKRLDEVDLVLQAGTFHWTRVPLSMDDGVVNTHFGYVWEQPSTDAAWDYVMVNGWLPEVHVWAADPRKQHVVDLSTGLLPEACLATTGAPWLMPKPPEFVWEHVKELPKDGIWEPDQTATTFVREMAEAIWSGKSLVDPSGGAKISVVRLGYRVGSYVNR